MLSEAGQRFEKSCPAALLTKKVELWAMLLAKTRFDRKMQWLGHSLLYILTTPWLALKQRLRCELPLLILKGEHERFCGRIQKYLHRRQLQTGLRLRGEHKWKFATSGKTRGEVQVFKASLPSPVARKSSHFQLAAEIQAKEMAFRRCYSGIDSRHPSHSARWVNIGCHLVKG